MTATDLLLLAPTTAACVVYLLVMGTFLSQHLLFRPRPWSVRPLPSVSILKPLAGNDDNLRGNLETFARLDYARFEILLGIASADDPAWSIARSFAAHHPDLRIRVFRTDRSLALNPKVAQLIALTRKAKGEVIVVSDSNVAVRETWLTRLVAELQRPGVGLVTNTVVGSREHTLGAAIENAHLTAYILPLVVALSRLFGRPISIGKSMAMRRADLLSVGGWECVSSVLAEDDMIGRRFAERGHRVAVSLDPVFNTNSDCTVMRTLERHTRWARMRRSIDPVAHAAEGVVSPVALSVLLLTAHPGRVTLAGWLAASAMQLIGSTLCLTLARGRAPSALMLTAELVRPYVALCCWTLGWTSRKVDWRGNRFLLRRGSELIPLADPGSSPSAVPRATES